MHDLIHKNHAPSKFKTWSQELEEHTPRPTNPNNLWIRAVNEPSQVELITKGLGLFI